MAKTMQEVCDLPWIDQYFTGEMLHHLSTREIFHLKGEVFTSDHTRSMVTEFYPSNIGLILKRYFLQLKKSRAWFIIR